MLASEERQRRHLPTTIGEDPTTCCLEDSRIQARRSDSGVRSLSVRWPRKELSLD